MYAKRPGTDGKCVAKPSESKQLAASKGKDCDRLPHHYVEVRHVNWGRFVWMPRECDPDDRQAGGVPVVVGGREILLQGEGEQFE